jgi:hypothetical protein
MLKIVDCAIALPQNKTEKKTNNRAKNLKLFMTAIYLSWIKYFLFRFTTGNHHPPLQLHAQPLGPKIFWDGNCL